MRPRVDKISSSKKEEKVNSFSFKPAGTLHFFCSINFFFPCILFSVQALETDFRGMLVLFPMTEAKENDFF